MACGMTPEMWSMMLEMHNAKEEGASDAMQSAKLEEILKRKERARANEIAPVKKNDTWDWTATYSSFEAFEVCSWLPTPSLTFYGE